MGQVLYRSQLGRTVALSCEALALAGLGYAIGNGSGLVAGAFAAVAGAALLVSFPALALVPLVLLYLVPAASSLLGLHWRDVVALSFGLLLLEWLRSPSIPPRILGGLALAAGFLVLILMSALGVLSEPGVAASLAELGTAMLVLMGGSYLGARGAMAHAVRAVGVVVLGVAVGALLTWAGTRGIAGGTGTQLSAEARTSLIFGNPNFLGTFLAVGAVLLTVLAWRRPPRLFHVLGAALVLAAMGTTGSRGALVVYGAGLLSAAFWLQARTKAVLAATMVVPIIFIGVGALTSARIQGSAAQGIDSATIEASPTLRFQAVQLALTLARQQPVSGVGYGRFPEYAAASDDLGVPFNTHNDYLRVWAESGLPSLLLLVGLFTMCLHRGSIYARADRSGLGAAAFAATSAYAVSLVTLNGLASAQYSVLWALLAGMLLGAPSPTHAPYPPTKE